MAINFFEPRTLLKVVTAPEFGAKTFLLNSFFRNIRTFTTRSIDIDIVPRSERFVAPFSNPYAGGKLVERKGYKTETFTPAYISLQKICTAEQVLDRLPGETIYDHLSPETRMSAIIANDLTDLDRRITRREEAMAAEALFKGQITIKGDDIPEKTLKFWDDADKPETEIATPWNLATAKPLEDLRAICDDIVRKTGKTPETIICGSKVANALLDRLQGDNSAINSRRIMLGQIDPRTLQDGVQYLGDLRYPTLQIMVYNEWHYDDTEKTDVPLIPENEALIVCRGAQTTRAYGMVMTADLRGMRGVVGTRVPNSYMSVSNPMGRIIQLTSAPLMVVHEPHCFHVVKAVDPDATLDDGE